MGLGRDAWGDGVGVDEPLRELRANLVAHRLERAATSLALLVIHPHRLQHEELQRGLRHGGTRRGRGRRHLRPPRTSRPPRASVVCRSDVPDPRL